jgi:hypothetical protein
MRVSASVSRNWFKKQRFPFVRRRRYGQTAASRTETGARRVWLKNASCTHAEAVIAMLQRPEGATVDEVASVMGWPQSDA